MSTVLHLLRADSSAAALPAIAEGARDQSQHIIVVLTDGAPPPPLPAGIACHRLGPGGLDHAALLDLIFTSDRVIAW
ncbi:MAG TPA: hypothetical protein VMT79_10160 [Candidatus Binatia bacterium]|nr:hypothetical protein [Candidatus Binatia bacterium]